MLEESLTYIGNCGLSAETLSQVWQSMDLSKGASMLLHNSDLDGTNLAMALVASYGIVISACWYLSSFWKERLHSDDDERYLRRARSDDFLSRLLLHVDSRDWDSENHSSSHPVRA